MKIAYLEYSSRWYLSDYGCGPNVDFGIRVGSISIADIGNGKYVKFGNLSGSPDANLHTAFRIPFMPADHIADIYRAHLPRKSESEAVLTREEFVRNALVNVSPDDFLRKHTEALMAFSANFSDAQIETIISECLAGLDEMPAKMNRQMQSHFIKY